MLLEVWTKNKITTFFSHGTRITKILLGGTEVKERVDLRYCIDHIQSHLYATVSMIGPQFWKSGNAIIAVSKELYPEAVMLSS